MPEINGGGFRYALQRMSEIQAAKDIIAAAQRKAEVANARKLQVQKMVKCGCDWAPVGEIVNPPIKKSAEIPFHEWKILDHVETPKPEDTYTSPFALIG